jgi:hypothetical protein
MRATCALVVTAVLLSTAGWADDKANYRKYLQDMLIAEEHRVQDIQTAGGHDEAIAKELLQLANARMKLADEETERAKAFYDAAAKSNGPEKAEIEGYAKELEGFAAYDRKYAEERKKAVEILERQRAEMLQGLQSHHATIERIKAKLAALK